MPEGTFTASATIGRGRWQHHRTRDHFGIESDLYVALAERIGPWEEGTPVHWVISALMDRLIALESSDKIRATATADAVIAAPGTSIEEPSGTWTSLLFANAVLEDDIAGSFTADSFLVGGAAFTADAVIRGGAAFTADAVLV